MSNRFAFLYQPADTFDTLTLLESWASSGVSMENPATGRTTRLSEDGDQVDISKPELVTAMSSHEDLTFQLWVSADIDICCRIRVLNDSRLVEEYSLDGLGGRIDEILDALLRRFKARAAEANNLFFVGDREGYTIEHNWDRLSLSGKYEDRIRPTYSPFLRIE